MNSIRMAVFIPLLAISAFAQDVRYNFAGDVDFSKYKTFKWVQIKGADQIDQITDGQIKSAVTAELAKKGLSRTEAETADLFVGYQVSLGQEKEVTTFDNGWGYGPGWGRGYGYGGGGFSTSTTSTITIGQVDLDIYDAAAKKLVWRGTASKTLDMKAKPEKREKNLRKGVEKLLKNYPPPPKKS
ncbi:MAG TPA: DUF4136 domain-containing protein [Bryobacteraceae bacterium]|jgi:hypothetical protein|nr:DUF4136 domain-containing protein [Bryobacteraceae bacterium]